jgi:ubiquinone/menaquinone biosynthesis C-methylase UbiE
VITEGMRAYYERRAREYDDWWLGTGLFAARDRPGWDEDVAALVRAVAALPPARVLDVACGTGFLTRHLRGEVTGLDQSAAMLEVAAGRAPAARLVQGEAVPLPFADAAFDVVFTGHFYGHLARSERGAFLREARRVAPRVVVVDSAQRPGGPAQTWQDRVLRDGSRHAVYKRWFTAERLTAELGGGEVLHDGPWFIMVVA